MAIVKPRIEEIIIAALLHDIGKFLQRTKQSSYKFKNEDLLCPYNSKNNRFTHKHVLYTDAFITSSYDCFPENLDEEQISILAAKHHIPDTGYQAIITSADWLSSGADRKDMEEPDEKKTYYKQPLRSIFDKVMFSERDKPELHYLALDKLSPENVFPKAISEISSDDYNLIWSSFEDDFKKLKNLPFKQYISSLNTMLEHYTWCIPSSTIHEPDISLYDHLSTTTGFAAVLYKYHDELNNLDDQQSIMDFETKKFLFISGDLSGIQNYIFNLSNTKSNAKILRARSFELEALSDTVAGYILNKIGLPPMCKIMNAGGRFILLVPNTDKIKIKLNKIKEKIEKFFIERYFGELTMNISMGVEASGNMLKQKNSQGLFAKISKDVALAKQHKLQIALKNRHHILDKEYNNIIEKGEVCEACDKRAAVIDGFCNVCNSLKNFGGMIPKSKYLYYTKEKSSSNHELEFINGIYITVSDKELWGNNFPAVINDYRPGFPVKYIPYYIPKFDEDEKSNRDVIKTFEDLGDAALGTNKIAMFKADVDNLGGAFSIGMQNKISISRYSSFSRMLNFFFSGYLNNEIKTKFTNIYTVYSGGDDLCVIGPWSDIIQFSSYIQSKFQEFTGNNPSLSLSGGISLSGGKVPVRNIAANAKEALECSKNEHSKNCITVFNTTTSWDEFRKLIKIGDEVLDKLEKDDFSKGIVYRLLDYHEREKNLKEGFIDNRNALWRSNFRYDVARNINNPKTREWFLSIVERNIDKARLLSSYILYKTRK